MKNLPVAAVLLSLLALASCTTCPCQMGKAESRLPTELVPHQTAAACKLKPVYFDHDEARPSSDSLETLKQDAACILSEGRHVVLYGHTDPRGTAEYNLAKGARMAMAVKAMLVKQGVPEGHIQTRSMGEDQPACHESGEACWSKCRRVELEFE